MAPSFAEDLLDEQLMAGVLSRFMLDAGERERLVAAWVRHHEQTDDGAHARDGVRFSPRRVEVRAEVGFVEDDDRARAPFSCEREIALDAARVEVAVEPDDDEDRIDVRRDDLLFEGEVTVCEPSAN